MGLLCWSKKGDFLRHLNLMLVPGNMFVAVICDLMWISGFFHFLEFLEEIVVLVRWRWSEAWGWVREVVVQMLVRMLIWVMKEMMAWVVKHLDGGFVTGFPGFAESFGKSSQTVFHSFSIPTVMCFWSAWKGEVVVNVVEVLTDECVEVWEDLRLDSYLNLG